MGFIQPVLVPTMYANHVGKFQEAIDDLMKKVEDSYKIIPSTFRISYKFENLPV
jgi:hypothetical protein